MSKVYDTVMFFNELDLLEIRMEYLDDVVDYFVVSESPMKTGKHEEKPLYFADNKERFKKWKHKIIHNVVDVIPNPFVFEKTESDYQRKVLNIIKGYTHYPHNVWIYDNVTYQREMSINNIVDKLNDDDVLIISDLDEIPNKDVFKEIDIPEGGFVHCMQSMRQYYVNVEKNEEWFGSKVLKAKYLKSPDFIGINGLRMKKEQGNRVKNCGWHLTFLGGVEKIKEKIQTYEHQEFNKSNILDNIEERIKNNQDIYNRGERYTYSDVSMDMFPNNIRTILEKYPKFIK